MKRPDGFLTNTTTIAGRAEGQAINDPGGGLGSGMDQEIYNDPAYAIIGMGESWKENGISDSNETTVACDMRDAIEEMASKKVDGVSDYAPGTSYTAPGTATDLVMHNGFQFINISNVANLGNDPLLNPGLWYKIPTPEKLMDQYYSGEVITGGLSPLADRAGVKYLQNLLFGNFRPGGNGVAFRDFFRVHLDGTIVTGDPTLEDDIFQVGTGTEYFNIDLIAPDVVGTRTLLDMGGRTTRAQSSGGQADTLGDVQEDAAQKITGQIAVSASVGLLSVTPGGTGGALKRGTPTYANVVTSAAATGYDLELDNSLSTSPNAAKTDDVETRMANLVEGVSYIIVMQAA